MRRRSRSRPATAAALRTDPAPARAATPVGEDRAEISGYRLLRRVAAGDRAAVYLASSLHRTGSSPPEVVALRIYEAGGDDARVSAEIAAMTADATGTLPALVDVTALDDGRCVLAVERLAGPTLARLLTERSLEPGEAVTLLAPIAVAVAGLAEAGFVHTRLAPNDVLIDGAGRPRLIGLGAIRRLDEVSSAIERTELLREGHAALAALVAGVAEATRPRGCLDRAVAAIGDAAAARPFVRSEALLERTLFESAAASPVRGIRRPLQPGAVPARVADPVGAGAGSSGPSPVVAADDQPTVGVPLRRRGVLGTLAALAQLPAEAIEHGAAFSDVDPVPSFMSRLGRALRARRRAVLVASLVGGAVLVLLLTVVPPAGEARDDAAVGEGTAAAAAGSGQGTAPADGGVSAEGVPAEESRASGPAVDAEAGAAGESLDDPVDAAAALLARREDCLALLDAACLEPVDQAGSAIEQADLASLSGARDGTAIESIAYDLGAIEIAAEMGDAVLVTVPYADPEREPASLLVMRSEAGWRLRELFD